MDYVCMKKWNSGTDNDRERETLRHFEFILWKENTFRDLDNNGVTTKYEVVAIAANVFFFFAFL